MSVVRLLLLVFFLPLAGCAQSDDFDLMIKRLLKGDVPFSHPHDLNKTDAVVLDAREYNEYEVSHIAGALYVGYDDFDLARVASIDREASIVVYCSVGYRSEKIARQLSDAGFNKVTNLYGGIFKWVNEGHPVEDRNGPTHRVHTYNKRWSKWLEKGEKVYE